MSRIEDVALAAGVSTATVSRALRGLPKVSPHTRQRVLEAAERLRYVASPTASSLASGRTGVIAVVVPYATRWYFAQLIAGAAEALRREGYHVLLFDVGDEGPGRDTLLEQRMFLKRVDAVLVLSLRMLPAELEVLHATQLPVATVGIVVPGLTCVRIDDRDAVTQATAHLLGLGHERIGFVGATDAGSSLFTTPTDRQQGFVDVMHEHGLAVEPWQLQPCPWTADGGRAAGRALLDRPDPPTGVVAASDEMAMGVLAAARDLGLAVPGRLSVVGIDDHELASVQDLTTVAQPVQQQGRLAADALLALLAGDGEPDVVTVPTTLVVRGTSGPVPRGRARSARSATAARVVAGPGHGHGHGHAG